MDIWILKYNEFTMNDAVKFIFGATLAYDSFIHSRVSLTNC